MTIGSSVVDIARSQVGITESPPNSNHILYWDDLGAGLQGQPWCAAFTAWCWQRAGVDLVRELGYGAYRVYTVEAWARKIGALVTDHAEDGDLVIYGIGEGHIGIAWPDLATPTYRAIEGNTSAGNNGSQDNGGGVFVRHRDRSLIRGWVRMSIVLERIGGITAAPVPAPVQPVQPAPPIRPQIAEDGQLGPQTYRALQRVIGTTPDGAWGPMSKRALQRWLGVTQDGIIGRQTVTALQQRVGAYADGIWGPATTRALQRYINTRV